MHRIFKVLALALIALCFALAQTGVALAKDSDGSKTRRVSPVIVVFETSLGKFEVSVDVERAPVTASNFLKYVDESSYNNGFFHRTVRPDT